MEAADYDPFARGPFSVGVRTIQASDPRRSRIFTCEIWHPAEPRPSDQPSERAEQRDIPASPGTHPLIVYSHSSGGHRRSATFLANHLASHGYVVTALDHSERVAPELAGRETETAADRAARIDAIIASRVPDIRFLLDLLLGTSDGASGIGPDHAAADLALDGSRVGLVGHSFGGWTVLATVDVEPRVRSVVAMAPGGNAHPRPGILRVSLSFGWGRNVPTLYLAAEQDTMIPVASAYELFDRTPASKRLFILRRADHQHFVDDVEGEHEALRAMSLPGDAAWIPAAMRPISELSTGEQAHIFVRGLTLAHLDATLRQIDPAQQFLEGDVEGTLAALGVETMAKGVP